MRITDPVLVPDTSVYVDHIIPQEFIDGGCESIVIGIYSTVVNSKKVLHPTTRAQFEVATKSSLLIQAYIWDDIILDPIVQADWVVQTIKSEGLPVKWLWADQEMYWTNWVAWDNWRHDPIKYPASTVPVAKPINISSHNQVFMERVNSQFPNSGVYTNNGFVASWASGMNTWLPKYKSWVPEYLKQPKEATKMTWAQLKANWLPDFDITLATGQLPEKVAGLQFTGDTCILPGSYNYANVEMSLDVSVFSKTFIDGLRSGVNIPIPAPKPPIPAPIPTGVAYRVLYPRINVRNAPSGSAQWVRYAVLNEIVYVSNISNGWAQLTDNTWIFASYLQKV